MQMLKQRITRYSHDYSRSKMTTAANWQNQIIKPGAVVSGGNASGTNVSTAQQTVTTANADAQLIYNMTQADRQQLALMLRNAGYQVSTSGKFSVNLVARYQEANLAAQQYAQLTGKPLSLRQYLTDPGVLEEARMSASGGTGGYGAGMGLSRTETTIASPTQAAGLINQVYQDLVGRTATDAELQKYTKALQEAQKKNPTQIQYESTGRRPSYTIQQGVDPQQFLIQQIAGSDAAKANSVLGFYDAFKQAIGVK